jgi:hypothetical protein
MSFGNNKEKKEEQENDEISPAVMIDDAEH